MLEVTARAITYYLDVSAECTRRIISMEGAVKAICNRLVVAELDSRTSRDLAEQCIKVSTRLDAQNATVKSRIHSDAFFVDINMFILLIICFFFFFTQFRRF